VDWAIASYRDRFLTRFCYKVLLKTLAYFGFKLKKTGLKESMNISLSKELEQLIQEKVKSGRYLSVSEVVGEALQLLNERDRVQEARLAELKAKIREGIEELDRGERIDGEEVFAELEEDIRRIEAEREQPDTKQGRGWSPGFSEKTFGAFKNDPLVIDSE
jgi:antitoxin ParD1/3/4